MLNASLSACRLLSDKQVGSVQDVPQVCMVDNHQAQDMCGVHMIAFDLYPDLIGPGAEPETSYHGGLQASWLQENLPCLFSVGFECDWLPEYN
jgi:hypothetical protein